MTLTWNRSESGINPPALDTTSSAYYVYLRKNIEEVTKKMEDDREYTSFVYDEAILTKEEYALYVSETDMQLVLAELAEQQEASNTALQEAIAELAESVIS